MPRGKRRNLEYYHDLLFLVRTYHDTKSWQTTLELLKRAHRLTDAMPKEGDHDTTKRLRDYWKNNVLRVGCWAQSPFQRVPFRPTSRDPASQVDDEAAHAAEETELENIHQQITLMLRQLNRETVVSSAPKAEQSKDAPALAAHPTSRKDLELVEEQAAEQKQKRKLNAELGHRSCVTRRRTSQLE